MSRRWDKNIYTCTSVSQNSLQHNLVYVTSTENFNSLNSSHTTILIIAIKKKYHYAHFVSRRNWDSVSARDVMNTHVTWDCTGHRHASPSGLRLTYNLRRITRRFSTRKRNPSLAEYRELAKSPVTTEWPVCTTHPWRQPETERRNIDSTTDTTKNTWTKCRCKLNKPGSNSSCDALIRVYVADIWSNQLKTWADKHGNRKWCPNNSNVWKNHSHLRWCPNKEAIWSNLIISNEKRHL